MTEGSHPDDAARDARFEDRIVTQVMTIFGLGTDVEALRQAAVRENGTRQISLALFHAQYRSFPVRLETSDMALLQGVELPDLYMRFTKSAPYAAYRAFCERDGLDDGSQKVGLVFPWPEYLAMSIHNMQERCIGPLQRSCVASVSRRFSSGVALTIEPFEVLLSRIRGIWQP